MGKNLPAIDFHAAVAKRDPALAERLIREGISSSADVDEKNAISATPTAVEAKGMPAPREKNVSRLAISPPQNETRDVAQSAPPSRRRRGLVPRANGQDAGRVTVYVPPSLVLHLKQFCFDCDRTMSDVAGEILVEALERKLGVSRSDAS